MDNPNVVIRTSSEIIQKKDTEDIKNGETSQNISSGDIINTGFYQQHQSQPQTL